MQLRFFACLALLLSMGAVVAQEDTSLPDTGISGLYEVMTAVEDPAYAIAYFAEFGFHVVDSTAISAEDAFRIYGVRSALKSYRLQNGEIDSHGLVRLLCWAEPLGEGVGYAPPETIGQRMSVMRTRDIFRLVDIYEAARNSGEAWLPIEPIADDLYGMSSGQYNFFERPVQVRETGIYGTFFNHVFFQRYGYTIPGYGTIGAHSPLRTSEFTHHDFIIRVDDIREMDYLRTALGLRPEKEPEIDGDWQKGPRRVFQFEPGDSHWYWGFVSPNNICGKLKFFVPRGDKLDRSAHQRIGELGITLHSFYTARLDMVHERVMADESLESSAIETNEFGERSFVFTGPAGCSWQIIEKTATQHQPLTELRFETVNE